MEIKEKKEENKNENSSCPFGNVESPSEKVTSKKRNELEPNVCPFGNTSAPTDRIEPGRAADQSNLPEHLKDYVARSGEHVPNHLSTKGLVSSIPRGEGEGKHWVYPSPQRFFLAMRRKGYEPNSLDIDTVVAIHNTVNETAWSQVMEFEKMHDCQSPKLVRFRGRPQDLSIRARINMLMGYKRPFDRHDWVVDRCGEEVGYILDFYHGATEDSLFIDVRPDLRSVSGWVDRIKMQLKRPGWFGGDRKLSKLPRAEEEL